MRLWLKMLIGAVLGLIGAPVLYLAAGEIPSGRRTAAAMLTLGPIFGAALAFSLHRYGAPIDQPLSWSEEPRGIGRVSAAGAMAGGCAGAVAYLLDFLPSPWYVLPCFVLGGMFVASHWIYGNIKRP